MPLFKLANDECAEKDAIPPRERGFVLIVVLWIVALLALSATMLASATTSYLDISRNDVERVRATLLADAGIQLAMQELLVPQAQQRELRFTPGASGHACRMPDGELVTVRIEDEAGKIDLNLASDELIRALLTGVGVADERADALVDAIADYRDPDDERRLNGAEAPEYLAAGRPVGPKNAPFDSVVELGSVLGITTDLFQRLAPFVTVDSGQAGVDPRVAHPALLKLLSPAAGPVRTEIPQGAGEAANPSIPSQFVVASAGRSFSIQAVVKLLSGTTIARRALVVRIEGVSRVQRPQPGEEPLADNMSRPRPRDGRVATDGLPGLRVKEWGRASTLEISAPPSDNSPQC